MNCHQSAPDAVLLPKLPIVSLQQTQPDNVAFPKAHYKVTGLSDF